jgi:tetratricopeptide (TPR) repeat protein
VGALPRPEVPPGGQRDLVDALHELHHQAGWPSLRVLARQAGCSHTTVSAVFSSPRLPGWGVLELLVAAMDGDVAQFRRLWLDASTPRAAPAPGELLIAGRKPELVRVRRHLEQGTGLLLVTGEAGMGKTRLVSTASTLVAPATCVVAGACLPLSRQVPLLPVSDVLRAAHAVDGGRWLEEAVTGCAPYVAGSLQRLLPELGDEPVAPAASDDAEARQRLFGAVESVLGALASRRPFAVMLEDLHWADSATLDLIEHVLAHGRPLPILGTWRLDDPTTPEATTSWWQRVRRLSSCAALELQSLDRDGTAAQIELLVAGAPDPELVDRIHRRSRGQPLFTEQLVGLDEADDLPRVLADLLDRRLSGLRPPAEAVARALGVADRALPDTLLPDITELAPVEVATGLHELADRRLLRPMTGHEVELSHPLLAEATRRRLLAFEVSDEHRRLAHALASHADASPAEVAEHWRRAEEPGEEVAWRIAAAQAATHRVALAEAATQWRRALVLWPEDAESVGTPPVRKHDAFLATMDALVLSDPPAAWDVAQQALRELPTATGPDAAAVLRRAGSIRGWLDDPRGGLELVGRALDIHRSGPRSLEHVRALQEQDTMLDALGRFDEAREAATLALQTCAGLDAPTLRRSLLSRLAVYTLDTGDLEGALALFDEAAHLELDGPDPEGDVFLAHMRTEALREAGRVGDDVVDVGRPGLEAAAAWGLATLRTYGLRGNMASALRLAGQVRRAAELIDPVTARDQPSHASIHVHHERACLDMLRGRRAEALARFDATAGLPIPLLPNRIEAAEKAATVDLWCGRPQLALDRLARVIGDAARLPAAAHLGADLALIARAGADLADAARAPHDTRHQVRDRLERLLAEVVADPFALSGCFLARPAHGAAWAAETARLVGRPSLDLWDEAAARWDRIGRPHDAAYCRWRGAQLALTTGRRTIAQRLLHRAAHEAREHVPLSAAIAATSVPQPPGR